MAEELPTQVANAEKKAEELERKIGEEPVPDGSGADVPAQDSDKDWKAEYEKAKHKYDVLQGKYNAEIPRLSQELEELKSKNAVSEEEEVSDEDLFSGITDDTDVEKIVEDKLKPVKDVVDTLANSTYTKTLTEKVPDWQEIYNDGDFVEWLNIVEPASGRTRLDLAKEAEVNRNADRVAWFLQQYKSSKSKPASPSVETYVSPASSSSKISSSQTAPPMKLNDEIIRNYYSAVARGKVSEDTQKVMEAQIQNYIKGK